jgi:predicted RNA-binding Zn-ribbon protein involved in translation (DUF1610 family)
MIKKSLQITNDRFWCPNCDKFLTKDQVEVEPDNSGHWDGVTFVTFCIACGEKLEVEEE